MAEKRINNFLKHKRLIVIGLVIIGLFIMVILTYVLTYATNRPKAFKDDKRDKDVKKCFDFNLYASEVSLKKVTGKSQYLKLTSEITNVTETIFDVSVKYELHSNWTSKGDYTPSSDYKFNSGDTITKGTKSIFPSTSATINLNNPYPIKVLPLVRVKAPTVYAKVTYSRKLSDDMYGKGETVTESVYFTYTYSQYVSNRTTIIG